MQKVEQPEPWLRGTLNEVPAVQRAVLHALELAREDLERWTDGLTDAELNARPGGIAPVAFHLRHIARSADRLLTYAEGSQLSPEQLQAMKSELAPGATRNELLAELVVAISKSARRIRAFSADELDDVRDAGHASSVRARRLLARVFGSPAGTGKGQRWPTVRMQPPKAAGRRADGEQATAELGFPRSDSSWVTSPNSRSTRL